jgi:ribosome-binding protein aMBF1 (putative translation factor)
MELRMRRRYPGDEAIIAAFAQVAREARESAGMTIEEAEAAIAEMQRTYDYTPTARAIGIVFREARIEQRMSMKELARVAKVPLQIIEDIERGKPVDLPLTHFVRLSFGVCVDPPEIIRRMEEFKERLRTQ